MREMLPVDHIVKCTEGWYAGSDPVPYLSATCRVADNQNLVIDHVIEYRGERYNIPYEIRQNAIWATFLTNSGQSWLSSVYGMPLSLQRRQGKTKWNFAVGLRGSYDTGTTGPITKRNLR